MSLRGKVLGMRVGSELNEPSRYTCFSKQIQSTYNRALNTMAGKIPRDERTLNIATFALIVCSELPTYISFLIPVHSDTRGCVAIINLMRIG